MYIGNKRSVWNRDDPTWYYEELYRTMRGKFILVGEGNAETHWNGGRGTLLLTIHEAQAWVKRFVSEIYDEIFGVA